MKFSIGTASSNMEFEEDIRLIKSSLLYADEIELIGMAEYAIFIYLPKCLKNPTDIETLFSNLSSLLRSFDNENAKAMVSQIETFQSQFNPYISQLKKRKRRTRQEIIAQMKMNQFIDEAKIQLTNCYNSMTNNNSIRSINNLVDRGLIKIYDYSYNGFNSEEMTGGYFANLLSTIKHGSSYPLIDSITASVVSSVINNKFIDFSKIDKEMIRHAGVANNILSTLPTLERATIDEILDFKKDMLVPLNNFRRAIYDFSTKITSMPWDDDFCYECIKLYDTEVMPKINEINELSSETSVLKNFGVSVLNDEEERQKMGYAGAGLITAITTNSNIFDALGFFETVLKMGAQIGLTAAGIAAFLKTADVLREAYKASKEKKEEIKGNAMYYYYKASQKI